MGRKAKTERMRCGKGRVVVYLRTRRAFLAVSCLHGARHAECSRLIPALCLLVLGLSIAPTFLPADLRHIRPGEAAAAPAKPSPESAPSAVPAPAPVKVRVGLVLLAVGDVNIAAETYEMGFYLIFNCDRPCNPNNFEIMNGHVITQELQDNSPTYRVFRVRASLRRTLDLRSYPFDRYPVSISIEDKLLADDKLVYVPDPQETGIDSDVHIPGWILAPHWLAGAKGHDYPAFHKTYSRYTFSVTITRPPLAGFLRVLVPGLFLVGIGLLALLLGPDRVMQRLTVSTSALVGAMLFHLNLTSSISPIGYLTFADRFMIINYIVLTLSVASTVILLYLTDKNRTEEAKRIHLLLGLTLPAVWIVLQIINVVAL